MVTPQTAILTSPVSLGRPLVDFNINGKKMLYFLDTSVVDASFPGDILIGVDLLRWLPSITLQSHEFSVVNIDA